MGVGVGVVGESGLGAGSGLGTGSAVTDLGRTGGGVKLFRCAAMMIRARACVRRALREITVRRGRTLRRAALVVSLVTSAEVSFG